MRKGKIVLIVVLVSAILLLSACGALASPEEDAFVEEFLNSIEHGDYSAHYDDFIKFGSEDEFTQSMKQLDDYYNGEIIKLRKTGIYVRSQTQNGQTTHSKEIAYQVETLEDTYIVNMVTVSEDGEEYLIYSLNIIESSELAGNGAIINFEDFDVVQLLLLVFSVLCIGFMIFAIVLCAKSKVRLKGLWIPIIALIQTGVSITAFPNLSKFNFLFFTTNISSLRKFLDGGTILTVLVPVGAILFVALRKHLIKKANEYREQQALLVEQQVARQEPDSQTVEIQQEDDEE